MKFEFDGNWDESKYPDYPKYPEVPGFKKRDTSEQAAVDMREEASKLQWQCLWAIRRQPSTADEVAKAVGRDRLAIRPRLSELAARSRIEDSGVRRPNASGKSAIVWRVRM